MLQRFYQEPLLPKHFTVSEEVYQIIGLERDDDFLFPMSTIWFSN
jgi:hypothetical protein